MHDLKITENFDTLPAADSSNSCVTFWAEDDDNGEYKPAVITVGIAKGNHGKYGIRCDGLSLAEGINSLYTYCRMNHRSTRF